MEPMTVAKAKQLYEEAEQLYLNGLASQRQVMAAQKRLHYIAVLHREASPFTPQRQAVTA